MGKVSVQQAAVKFQPVNIAVTLSTANELSDLRAVLNAGIGGLSGSVVSTELAQDLSRQLHGVQYPDMGKL